MGKYYLYRHIRLDKNKPFYIGIGKKRRENFKLWRSEYERAFETTRRNKHWKSIVELTSYDIEILFESDDDKLIREKEIEFIFLYGRSDLGNGSLVNHTDGGEGFTNLSEESRQKHRLAHIGKTGAKRSELTRMKMREAQKNKIGMKGENHPFFNKHHSESSKKKMRKSHLLVRLKKIGIRNTIAYKYLFNDELLTGNLR